MYRVLIDGAEYAPFNTVELKGKETAQRNGYYYELELSELIFGADVYNLISSSSDICAEFEVVVEEYDGAIWNIVFTGYTTKLKCEFDEIRCSIKCKIVSNLTIDCLLRQWEEEHNFLQVSQVVETEYLGLGDGTELYLIDGNNPTLPNSTLPSYNPMTQEFLDLIIQPVFLVGWIIGRQLRYTYNTQNNTPNYPATDYSHNQTGWKLISNDTTRGISLFYSAVSSTVYNTFGSAGNPNTNNYQIVSCNYPTNGTPCVNSAPTIAGDWFLYDEFNVIGTNNNSVYSLFLNRLAFGDTIPNGRRFDSTLNFLLTKIDCNISQYSTFMRDATNPISNHNPNPINTLVLHHKSDVRNPNASDTATIAKVNLKSLVEDFCELFNCVYYIGLNPQGGEALRIEHRKTVADALGVGTDLTTLNGGEYIRGKRKFKYQTDTIPLLESPQMPLECDTIDFVGIPIKYPNICRDSDNVTQSISSFECEVGRIFNNSEEGTDGVVLLNNLDCRVIDAQPFALSPISLGWFPNITLSWSFVHEHYHKSANRYLTSGEMNGNSETFTNTKRIKEEKGIKFPLCSFDGFNPSALIKTHIGEGKIKDFTYNFKTKLIEVNLKHEI